MRERAHENIVFTGRRWVELDRREGARRLLGRVALIVTGAVAFIVLAILYDAGTPPQ